MDTSERKNLQSTGIDVIDRCATSLNGGSSPESRRFRPGRRVLAAETPTTGKETTVIRTLKRHTITCTIAAGAVLAFAPAAQAHTLTCHGHAATIVGTAGDDVLVGTPGPDVIVAKGGADVVRGGGGNDIVCGGGGRDRLHGGGGADQLYGGKRAHTPGGGRPGQTRPWGGRRGGPQGP